MYINALSKTWKGRIRSYLYSINYKLMVELGWVENPIFYQYRALIGWDEHFPKSLLVESGRRIESLSLSFFSPIAPSFTLLVSSPPYLLALTARSQFFTCNSLPRLLLRADQLQHQRSRRALLRANLCLSCDCWPQHLRLNSCNGPFVSSRSSPRTSQLTRWRVHDSITWLP